MKQDLVIFKKESPWYGVYYLKKQAFSRYVKIDKQPLKIKKISISVCNFKDIYIFASGGIIDQTDEPSK